MVKDLSVNLAGWQLDNPIIPASGTFGFGASYADLYDLNVLGSISIKGTTPLPRLGNLSPRIAETPSGMLNAVGLENPGVDKVRDEELPRLATWFHKPIVANISGFSVADYVECVQKLDPVENVGIHEINVSCPNVKGGGITFGTDAAAAASVVRAVKEVATKPVFIKLSPNVTNIVEIAQACVDAGADGISLINTLLGMRLDTKRRAPLLANRTGGLSGPAVFPVALRMVWDVYAAVDVPIIGMGGVSTARDVIDMMLAGATAVQVGSANLIDPWACPKIIEELPAVMEEYGIEHLAGIVGAAHLSPEAAAAGCQLDLTGVENPTPTAQGE